MPPQPSLAGLPIELRNHIYAYASSLLRLTTIDLVFELVDFVAENGRSASTLRIDLRRPKDIPVACESLRRWLSFIDMLDVQELATVYRVTPAANKDFHNYVHTDPLLIELYYLHEAQWEGPARTDLYRFLHAWWARRTVELQLCSGTACSKYPSPDDIPGLRSREHALLHDSRLHLLAPHYFER
ncbi:hypothetical protein AC578_7319 [Pseudocercospora eumusae]|uniref:Uncharacterized protein n=1 Tax=Pseudocercospora eumusae TaxID=321146 RepID=A0A139HWY9_9PEZI|nr:hypothetical protein AC578_7319 [Pseudocercospora eumusae]